MSRVHPWRPNALPLGPTSQNSTTSQQNRQGPSLDLLALPGSCPSQAVTPPAQRRCPQLREQLFHWHISWSVFPAGSYNCWPENASSREERKEKEKNPLTLSLNLKGLEFDWTSIGKTSKATWNGKICSLRFQEVLETEERRNQNEFCRKKLGADSDLALS